VDVEMAESVCVTKYGHVCFPLAMAYEVVGSTGDDKIDVLAKAKQLIDDISGCNHLDGVVGHIGLVESLRDDSRDGLERFGRLLAALENGSIGRLDCQRGNVCDDFRTSLEDDQEHTDRACLALQGQAIV
jgi:hypothetical protein